MLFKCTSNMLILWFLFHTLIGSVCESALSRPELQRFITYWLKASWIDLRLWRLDVLCVARKAEVRLKTTTSAQSTEACFTKLAWVFTIGLKMKCIAYFDLMPSDNQSVEGYCSLWWGQDKPKCERGGFNWCLSASSVKKKKTFWGKCG